MKPVVFDSWPSVAFFDNKTSAGEVEEVLNRALLKNQKMMFTVINLGEIWYNYARIYSDQFADDLIWKVQSMNIQIIETDWKQARIASKFKKKGGISYADCFAAALAKQADASLVTGDNEFKQVESEVNIVWV